ncbi:unnamed protein product, partial [Rotaria magnacalcarata]
SKLHHQESIYVSNAISSSQACLIQQSSEEQQYRSSQDFISHCGDYESVARIQLNHRKKEEDKKAAVSTKPSAPNFMAIMEQAAKYGRDKIHPQSESENNDESSQWNDSDYIVVVFFCYIILLQISYILYCCTNNACLSDFLFFFCLQ